ncbi:MAG: hypothetical protein K2P14_06595 [Anaeroplasmataceae bacterium]|nr:hypothetical protein [Anaeroplasmataceae bacterium]
MQQLTKEEKEALPILLKKHDLKLRIYFFENHCHVFIKKGNDIFPKMTFNDGILSFKLILKKIENSIINK